MGNHELGCNNSPQLIVLGIDCASWEVLDPYLERGELPNIAQLRKRGVSGVLKSVLPPVSACSWSSLTTGVNPGRHGVTGWCNPETGSPYSLQDVRAPGIWDILSGSGISVGVFNIPITYPAAQVNGFMVSGEIGAPHYDERMFSPREMYDEARRVFPNYPLRTGSIMSNEGDVRRLLENPKARLRMAEWLLSNQQVDVVMACVNYVDFAQHAFMNERRHQDTPDMILWAYREADAFLGMLRELAGSDTYVMLVSDHGAGPVEGFIDIRALLQQADLLALRRDNPSTKLLWRLRSWASRILARSSLLRNSRTFARARNILKKRAFDWSNTRAYYSGGYTVAVNTAGRTPAAGVEAQDRRKVAEGAARSIEECLSAERGAPQLMAHLSWELYDGDFADSGPEIVLEPEGFRYHVLPLASQRGRIFWKPEELREEYPQFSQLWQGMHRLDGIFAVEGPQVERTDAAESATVMDIAPTMARLVGIEPRAGQFDGRPLVAGSAGRGDRQAGEGGADPKTSEMAQRGYSEEEAERVREHLQDLGYL